MHPARPQSSHSSPKSSPAPPCELRVGTGGYAYAEWIDSGFYPADTPTGKMLSLYAQTFTATELNHTWYQLPKADMLERQQQQVAPGFCFAAKLTRTLTHEVDAREWKGQARAFRNGVAPLLQARQLAAVLVQLPPAFDYALKNRQYLGALLSELDGLPLAVEFRHDSWITDKVFSELSKRRVTLATADGPALPGLPLPHAIVTNPALIYARFYGRNARGWQSGKMHLQFDYDYSSQELREWADQRINNLAQQARRGLLFFINHVRGQAANNARDMLSVLTERGLQAR